jgi:hypothetical protein
MATSSHDVRSYRLRLLNGTPFLLRSLVSLFALHAKQIFNLAGGYQPNTALLAVAFFTTAFLAVPRSLLPRAFAQLAEPKSTGRSIHSAWTPSWRPWPNTRVIHHVRQIYLPDRDVLQLIGHCNFAVGNTFFGIGKGVGQENATVGIISQG